MSQPSTLPLIDYVEMVWRRRILVVVVVLVMTAAALTVSLIRTPTYGAAAVVAVSQQQLDTNFNLQPQEVSARQLQTQAALVTSDGIARAAVALGATSTVQTTASQQSNLITISAFDSDPARAARTANAYADAYVQVTTSTQRQVLDDAANELRDRITLLQGQIDPLLGGDQPASLSAVSALQQEQSTMQGQLGRLEVQKTVASGAATLAQEAQIPAAPVSPNVLRDTAFALAVSLVLGAAFAVVFEMWGRRREERQEQPAPLPGGPRTQVGLGRNGELPSPSPVRRENGPRADPTGPQIDSPTARIVHNGHAPEWSGSR